MTKTKHGEKIAQQTLKYVYWIYSIRTIEVTVAWIF